MASEFRLSYTAAEINELLRKMHNGGGSGDNGGGSTGGVSSWNDLTDKPFGEEVANIGDTIAWDGTPNENSILMQANEAQGMYMYLHYASSSVPTIEQMVGGTLVAIGYNGNETSTEITADTMQQLGDNLYSTEMLMVTTEDNVEMEGIVFPKKGVYFMGVIQNGAFMMGTKSFSIPNYNFVATVVHQIDPKYIPTSIYGVSGTATLSVANWDTTAITYTLTVEDLGTKDAIFLSPVTAADKSAIEEAEAFISSNGQTVIFTAATVPATDIQLNYFIVRGA